MSKRIVAAFVGLSLMSGSLLGQTASSDDLAPLWVGTNHAAEEMPELTPTKEKPRPFPAQKKPGLIASAEKPAPTPVQEKPAPTTVQEKPAPTPVQEKPAPTPVQEKPTPPAVAVETIYPPHAMEPLAEGGPYSTSLVKGAWSFEVEYLLWFFKEPNFNTAIVNRGAPGDPADRPLFGNARLPYSNHPLSGERLTLGYSLTDQGPVAFPDTVPQVNLGMFITYTQLAQQSIGFANDTEPLLSRPFFDLNNRQESGLLIGAPGLATGGFSTTNNFGLWGLEANLQANLLYSYLLDNYSVDIQGGFRYLELREDFSANSTSLISPNLPAGFLPPAGSRIAVNDFFGTRNQFFGPQIGIMGRTTYRKLDFQVGAKLAIGDNSSEIHIEGKQVKTAPDGTVTTSQGGLLALTSNIGRYNKDLFTVMPQFEANLRYRLNSHLSLSAGYSFLMLSRVFRPGDQIDRVIDITQIPNFSTGGATPTGLNRPAVPFKDSLFFAQGLTTGLEITW